MSKAKLLFLVLAVGYVSIGVLSLIGVVDVSNIVLLGLSLSAFFTSLSDTLNQWIMCGSQKNHMSYIAKFSVKFINNRLETGAQQKRILRIKTLALKNQPIQVFMRKKRTLSSLQSSLMFFMCYRLFLLSSLLL